MIPPTWPESLEKPTRADYQSQRQDTRQRKRAAGAPGYRRRFSNAATNVSLVIRLSRQDKAVFDQFYDDVTEGGSLTFYMPDPVTDGWPVATGDGAPLLTGNGAPLLMAANWLCLFGDESPVETIIGVGFDIQFSVWVMP